MGSVESSPVGLLGNLRSGQRVTSTRVSVARRLPSSRKATGHRKRLRGLPEFPGDSSGRGRGHVASGTSAFVGALLRQCHVHGSQHTHSSAVSAYANTVIIEAHPQPASGDLCGSGSVRLRRERTTSPCRRQPR